MRTNPYTLEQFQDWLNKAKITRPIDRVFIHHTAIPNAKQWRGLKTLTGIRNEHMKRFKTYDIGYHFIIAPNGRDIWLGRDINRIGAHALNNNTGTVGVVYAANFNEENPKVNGYDLGLSVVESLIRKLGLEFNDVYGHREGKGSSTSCPGSLLDMNAFRADIALRLAEVEHKNLFIDGYKVEASNAHISQGRLLVSPKALDHFFGWRSDYVDPIVPLRTYLEHKHVKILSVDLDKNGFYTVDTNHEDKE
jgi:hypothetical protein